MANNDSVELPKGPMVVVFSLPDELPGMISYHPATAAEAADPKASIGVLMQSVLTGQVVMAAGDDLYGLHKHSVNSGSGLYLMGVMGEFEVNCVEIDGEAKEILERCGFVDLVPNMRHQFGDNSVHTYRWNIGSGYMPRPLGPISSIQSHKAGQALAEAREERILDLIRGFKKRGPWFLQALVVLLLLGLGIISIYLLVQAYTSP